MNTKTIKVPETLFRSAKMEMSGDGDKKSLSMSISSDEPYKRYDYWNDEEYWEVLSHDPADVDDTRLKAGLPILFNHDRDFHLGRANSYSNDGHKITLSDFVEASGDEAQNKWNDARSGALPDTSVGYNILDDGKCVGIKDGCPVYSFKWAVNEASLVTIPADTTVGVGRSRDHKPEGIPKEIQIKSIDNSEQKEQKRNGNPNMKLSSESRQHFEADNGATATTGTTQTIEKGNEGLDAVNRFKENCKKIDAYVSGIKKPAWKELATSLASKHKEGEAKFDNFKQECLEAFAREAELEPAQTSPLIGMDRKEIKRYSICEAMRQAGSQKGLSGFYKEASEAVTKMKRGQEPDGFWIPDDVTTMSLSEANGLGRNAEQRHAEQIGQLIRAFAPRNRALNATNFAVGGALVGTDLLAGSLIELLLNKIVFSQMGLTYLGGLVGNIAIPKITGPTANTFWLPEGGTVTGTDISFAQLGLTPHRLASVQAYDKQLVAQASLSVEALVRDYIARLMAVEKDRAMINGSGTNGQPLGLLNIPGVQVVGNHSGTGMLWSDIALFLTALGTANADELGMKAWLTTPAARGNLTTLPKLGTASPYPSFMMDMVDGDIQGMPVGKMMGFPVAVSNNVPSNSLIFGTPGEFVVADWAAIDMVVNPYSLDTSAQVRITVTQWTDFGLRHEVAFAVGQNPAA